LRVNRSRSLAKKAMRRLGNTRNRPEQLLAARLIELHLPSARVETEVKMTDIVATGGVDLTGERAPRLDIRVVKDGKKYAIRLMGPPHDEKKQERYDILQALFLESEDNGYTVIDFGHANYHVNPMPTLFLRALRPLKRDEVWIAYLEIAKIAGLLLGLPAKPDPKLIERAFNSQ